MKFVKRYSRLFEKILEDKAILDQRTIIIIIHKLFDGLIRSKVMFSHENGGFMGKHKVKTHAEFCLLPLG